MSLRIVILAVLLQSGAVGHEQQSAANSSDGNDEVRAENSTLRNETLSGSIEKMFEMLDSTAVQKYIAVAAFVKWFFEQLGFDPLGDIKPKNYTLTWWILLCASHWLLRACQHDRADIPATFSWIESGCEVIGGMAPYLLFCCTVMLVVALALPAAIAFYLGTPSMLYLQGAMVLFFKLPWFTQPLHMQYPLLLCLPLHPAVCFEGMACFALFLLALGFQLLGRVEVIAFAAQVCSRFGLELLLAYWETTGDLALMEASDRYVWKPEHEMDWNNFLSFFCASPIIPWRVQRQFYSLFQTYFQAAREMTDDEKWRMVHGLRELFDHIDQDRNGKISGREFREFVEDNEGEFNQLVKKVERAIREKKLSISAGLGEKLRLTSDLSLPDGPRLEKGQEGRVVHLYISGAMTVKFENVTVCIPAAYKAVKLLKG